MSGTIGVIASDTGRYTLFSVSLMNLRHPVNTRLDWGLSNDIAGARNLLVERSLEVGSEWMLFIDDDHVYPDDLLLRLLAHDKDLVCSLYLARQQPFAPVAYSHREDNAYMPLVLPHLPETGLIPIHAAGASGMLIRSELFHAIDYPWFEHGRVHDPVALDLVRDRLEAIVTSDGLRSDASLRSLAQEALKALEDSRDVLWNASEDLIFCEKAREAGFEIWLDLEARLGHMTPSAIWPSWVDEEWAVGFSVADGLRLYCPIEKPAEADAAPADAVGR